MSHEDTDPTTAPSCVFHHQVPRLERIRTDIQRNIQPFWMGKPELGKRPHHTHGAQGHDQENTQHCPINPSGEPMTLIILTMAVIALTTFPSPGANGWIDMDELKAEQGKTDLTYDLPLDAS
jgi:hypothetical protein